MIVSLIPKDAAKPLTNTVLPLPNYTFKQIIIPGNFSDSIFSAKLIVSSIDLLTYLYSIYITLIIVYQKSFKINNYFQQFP